MGFRAKHGVNHNNKLYLEGETVTFSDEELEAYKADESGPVAELLARGAIEAFSPIVVEAQQALEAPLASMTPQQLGAVAKKLGIPKEPKLERDDLIKAIGEKRAEIAAQAKPAE